MTRPHRAAASRRASAAWVGLAVAGLAGCKGSEEGSSVPRAATVGSAMSPALASNVAPAPSAEPAASAVPSASVTAPAEDPAVERLIVWGRSEDAFGDQSFWLEWRPPELKVRGSRTGALIVAGEGVYRFQVTKSIGHGLKDCAPFFDPASAPIPNNEFTLEVKGASAKRLDADGDVVISPPESVEGASSYENSINLDASIGPYLFVSERADFVFCGAAHNGWSNSYYRYDLANQERVAFPTKVDTEVLRIFARQLAPELLKPCLDISVGEGSGEEPSLGALGLDFAIPRWSEQRGLYTELGFGIMRTYVEGVKTCGLEVSGLPESLKEVRVPAAFAAVGRKLPRFNVLGWSLVPAEATTAVERAFSRKGKPSAPSAPRAPAQH
jgi:hypothetical protein